MPDEAPAAAAEVLFWLLPRSTTAKNVLKSTNNKHLVIKASGAPAKTSSTATLALEVRLDGAASGQGGSTVVSFGRSADNTVRLDGANVSRRQARIYIRKGSSQLMIQDQSTNCTTHVLSPDGLTSETDFPPDGCRKLALAWGTSIVIRICQCDFEICWNARDTMHPDDRKLQESKMRELGCRRRRDDDDETDDEYSDSYTWFNRFKSRHQDLTSWAFHETEEIGRGSFGRVTKAIHRATGNVLAVKRLHGDVSCIASREGDISRRLCHANVAEFFVPIDFYDAPILLMRLYDGNATDLFMGNPAARSQPETSLIFFKSMLSVLAYLNREGIIHRDVKPDNILFRCIKERLSFYLSDFGLSKVCDERNTLVGTPIFAAPEVWRHEAQTHKVDVYSLAVSLLYLRFPREFPATQNPHPPWTYDQIRTCVSNSAAQEEGLRSAIAEDHTRRPSAYDLYCTLFEEDAEIRQFQMESTTISGNTSIFKRNHIAKSLPSATTGTGCRRSYGTRSRPRQPLCELHC